ncbi:AAEL017023-PA, partial [Aedes aegypti]
WFLDLFRIVNYDDNFRNYVILAPKYLRAKHPYQLSIATHDFNGFTKLHLAIDGYTENDEVANVIKEVHLKRSQTQLVEIDTTTLPPGSFSLNILSGSGGEVNLTIPLTVLDKAYTVLIQTNKPIYKPGNVIKFRVLLLDEATKPVHKPKAIHVTLADPDGNEIKVWPYAMLQNGVFQSQLEISNEPNLGNWSITANAYGKDHTFSFLVDDYKLPKYELKVSTPQPATVSDREFSVDVEARYIFGRPVKGNATITVNGPKKQSKTAKINGKIRLSFSMIDLLHQTSIVDEIIPVEVIVVIHDQYTRENIKATNMFRIFNQSYRLSLKKSSKYFIPGHPYRCIVEIKDQNGRLYSGPNGYHNTSEMRLNPESDGTVPLTLEVPEQVTHIELNISYRDTNEHFELQRIHFSTTGQIQASIITEQLTLNTPIMVQVQSSIALNHLTYQIIAKGKIQTVQQMRFDDTDSVQFNITATPEMIPNAKVFVFSMHNGLILKDTVPLMISSLPNWVNVTLPNEKVQPGSRIQLEVESTPNSLVGLLAVDRGAWLLGDGNQITKQSVLDEIGTFSDEIEGDNDDSYFTNYGERETIIVFLFFHIYCQHAALTARFGNFVPDEEDAYIPPRKEFPESWLWLDLQKTGMDGKLHIADIVPDSITNWEITAFSISPEHGLGVQDEPVALAVSKPFFITINVPNSIKKSEVAIVKVAIFSVLNDTSYVGVTLKNSRQEFEFVDNRGRKDVSYQAKNVIVTANSATTVLFKIKPKKMGNIVIKVIAETTEASDSTEQLLRVTPESLPYSITEKRLIQLQNNRQSFELELKIPRHIDVNSEEIHFSVQGNLLGDSVDGLDEMIRMPTGSGEQNVLKMVPNLVLLDYMVGVGKVNVPLRNRAIKFLGMGYQNQLKFKRNDGSFSMFGQQDNAGSVFLTALVAKTLHQASQFITVDEKVIENAYDWLRQQQKMDGSFTELGNIPEYGLQRKHTEKSVLTAYTLVAFLENDRISEKHKSIIDKGTQYLVSKIQGLESSYALALTAYALQLAQYKQEYAFSKLLENSQSNNGFRWWNDDNTAEATAYALLCYIQRGDFVDPLPILRWLISKRHLFGPDNIETTFIGLQAIAEHSKRISPNRNNYEVSISRESNQLVTLNINPETSLTVQNVSLPSNVRKVRVMVNGTGTGTFSIHYRYKTNILNLRPRFDVKVQTLDTTTSHYLDLKICAKFKPSEAYEISKLALMEITFPSGYIALDESVEELEKMDTIRKITTKYDDASLWLYFESLPEHFLCIPVTSFRQSDVLQQIPGSVRVYDFFDDSRVAITHFDGKQLDKCEICDNDCLPECGN